jgi:hypothetical protein
MIIIHFFHFFATQAKIIKPNKEFTKSIIYSKIHIGDTHGRTIINKNETPKTR